MKARRFMLCILKHILSGWNQPDRMRLRFRPASGGDLFDLAGMVVRRTLDAHAFVI